MIDVRSFYYPSGDGVHQIHGMEWTPTQVPPRGVVQIVHGLSEYIGRYAPFATWLAERGFVVVGNDHLGHGHTATSAAEYGYFCPKNGWETVVDDVRAVRVQIGERYPQLPYFVLGHSMGSFIARSYLIRWPATVDGAILSGTGQEPRPLLALGRVVATVERKRLGDKGLSPVTRELSLGAYNKKFRPNRTGADWISSDETVVDTYLQDKMCTFFPTVSMFDDMMSGLQFISDPKGLAAMDPQTPVYIFSGSEDPVGGQGKGVEKVAQFFRDAKCADLTCKLYPGGRHEMLNERNKEDVYADTLAWLEGHL